MKNDKPSGQAVSKLPPISKIEKTVLRGAVSMVDVLFSSGNNQELTALHTAAVNGNPLKPEEIPFAIRGLKQFGHINARMQLTEQFRSCILAVLTKKSDGSFAIEHLEEIPRSRSTRIRPLGTLNGALDNRPAYDSTDSEDEIEPEFVYEEDDDDL